MLKCQIHPNYKGKKSPKGKCFGCLLIFAHNEADRNKKMYSNLFGRKISLNEISKMAHKSAKNLKNKLK